MLVMALAATLIGFGLLVVALISGTLWLAVACIAVCVIGGVFLLADLLGLGNTLASRRSRRAAARTPEDADHPVAVDGDDPDHVVPGNIDAVVSDNVDAVVSDNEITTEFPRTESVEPVVSLDDTGAPEVHHRHSAPAADDSPEIAAATPVHHGRHETPDAEPAPDHRPRHGTPD